MKESCSSFTREFLPDLGVYLHTIKNLKIGSGEKFIGGTTYLMPSFVPYGHALMDCYSQFNLLKKYVLDVKPVFYGVSDKGWFLEGNSSKAVIKDLMEDCQTFDYVDLSKDSLEFENVVLMFDYTNSLSKEFYLSNGLEDEPHYPPFCRCYRGVAVCGESDSFKYNFAALDFLKTRFDSYKSKGKGKKIYVSREGVNSQYRGTIEYYEGRFDLTPDEEAHLYRAKARYYKDELILEEYFSSIGYEVVRPDFMGLFEQVSLFSKASHIAGVSGVGLFNMFWADRPIVYEVCVNDKYFYHHQTFGEYMGANYVKVEAYDSDPTLVIKAIEKAIS